MDLGCNRAGMNPKLLNIFKRVVKCRRENQRILGKSLWNSHGISNLSIKHLSVNWYVLIKLGRLVLDIHLRQINERQIVLRWSLERPGRDRELEQGSLE